MNVRHLRYLCSVLTALALAIPAFAQQIQISRDNRTIAVTTSGQAEALADTAVVSIGFISYGKDQNATYADASRQSNAIIDALTQSGIPKDAIESTQQEMIVIEPLGPESARYQEGFRFQFSQQWHVTVRASDAAGLLHTAIPAGANDSGDIEWKLKDENAIEADATRKALEDAKQTASHIAEGLGVKLGNLIYASNQTPGPGRVFALGALSAPKTRNLAPLAIAPQKITRSATIYAVFAIE